MDSLGFLGDTLNRITEINKLENSQQVDKYYAYSQYVDLTKTIFNNQHLPAGNHGKIINAKLLPKDEPMIGIVDEVAKIMNKKNVGHSVIADKINKLQVLKQTLNTTNMDEQYCDLLIDECISTMKQEGIKSLKDKGPLKGTKLTEEQYEKLLKQDEKLDQFFASFEAFSSQPKDKKNPFKEFIRVWTLSLDKCFVPSSKQKRNDRIEALQKNVKDLENVETPEILNPVKANLNFTLAMAMLAKEMKRSSPNLEEINKAKELLQSSAEFLEPAKIALKYNFIDKKNFNLSNEERKAAYEELYSLIKEAGCEEIVTKRDLKEVFKMMSPETIKKDKAIRDLKITSAVLTLPIAWTLTAVVAVIGTALAFLIAIVNAY